LNEHLKVREGNLMQIESYRIDQAENAVIVYQDIRLEDDKWKSKTFVFENFAQALEFLADNPIS